MFMLATIGSFLSLIVPVTVTEVSEVPADDENFRFGPFFSALIRESLDNNALLIPITLSRYGSFFDAILREAQKALKVSLVTNPHTPHWVLDGHRSYFGSSGCLVGGAHYFMLLERYSRWDSGGERETIRISLYRSDFPGNPDILLYFDPPAPDPSQKEVQ